MDKREDEGIRVLSAPAGSAPRLTSDGGSQKDDAALAAALESGGTGATHAVGAARAYLTAADRDALADFTRTHSLEEALAAESALLAGKPWAEAAKAAESR